MDIDQLMLKGYQHVLESDEWDERSFSRAIGAPLETVGEVHKILTNLKVIERGDADDGWKAVSPRVAMAKLVAPIEAEAERRLAHAASIRKKLEVLLPIHEAKRKHDDIYVVEAISDRTALANLIDIMSSQCRIELKAMHAQSHDVLHARSWYLNACSSGAVVRSIFRQTALWQPQAKEFMDSLGATRGVEIRIAEEVPLQAIIFDHASCVLIADNVPMPGMADEEDNRRDLAVYIQHPMIVVVIEAIFSEAWSRSQQSKASTLELPWIEDALRRSILRLLATGVKDEAVARKLGISTRTCRRYIHELMRDLAVASRFQAGVEAQRQDLL